jgi:hypothetical protein
MTEQVAHLGEWNAALHQPGRVLVPQVVPVQVDLTEPLLALNGEVGEYQHAPVAESVAAA